MTRSARGESLGRSTFAPHPESHAPSWHRPAPARLLTDPGMPRRRLRPRSRLTPCPSTPCRRRSGAAVGRAAASPTRASASSRPRSRSSASSGYDGATMRGIAARAGVDSALVHHYFGTKADLFARGRSARRCGRISTSRLCSTGRGTSSASASCATCSRRGSSPRRRKRGVVLLRAGIGNRLTTPLLAGFLSASSSAASPRARHAGCRAARASLVASQIAGHADRPLRAAAARAGRGIRRRPRRAGRADRAALPVRSNRRSGGREPT